MFYVHGLNPVEGNVTAAFKVIQHVLRSASNKDHTVAHAQYCGETTLRSGHCCMMSDGRAFDLNALQLAVSGDMCGEASKLSGAARSFVGVVEVPPCLSLSHASSFKQR